MNHRGIYKFIGALVILLVTLSSCNIRPRYVLNRKKMVRVTRDILLTDAYLSNHGYNDSIARLMYDGVFAKHHINRAKYDSSFIWYAKNAKKLASIYDQIESEMKANHKISESLYEDSIRINRIRYIGAEILPRIYERIMIPNDQYFYSWTSQLNRADTISSGDTLKYGMRLSDTLNRGEHILICSYSKDRKTNKIAQWCDTISPGSSRTIRLSHVVKDTIPTGIIHIRLTYLSQDPPTRILPLLIDSLSISSTKKVCPNDTICQGAAPEQETIE